MPNIRNPKHFTSLTPPIDVPTVDEGQRLSKVVMTVANCSRMQAERLIEAGCVRVDGQVCEDIPRRIRPQQQVRVVGDIPSQAPTAVTMLLHKPMGMTAPQYVAQLTESHHKDRSGQVLLKKHLSQLQCVAALEEAASGLVVLTQHTGVVRVFNDRPGLEHELMAEVRGHLTAADLPRRPDIKASIGHTTADTTQLRLAVKGYRVGDAWAWCREADLHLQSLRRIRIGRVSLKDLPAGTWRFLSPHEKF